MSGNEEMRKVEIIEGRSRVDKFGLGLKCWDVLIVKKKSEKKLFTIEI